MKTSRLRALGYTCTCALILLVNGCHRHRRTTSSENTAAYATQIQSLLVSPKLPALRWPDYSDYQAAVTTFYDDRNQELAWTRDAKPTPQATAFLQAFRDAGAKGLNPEDYDASRWPSRLQQLNGKSADAIAAFDVTLTVDVMRYISDLRIGRVNPQHFNFGIDVQKKKYDLPEFISDNVVDASDIPKLIAGVEPESDQYRQTEQALAHYLDLARQQQATAAPPLPDVAKPVATGGSYPAVPALWQRLQLEADAPAGADIPAAYTSAVSDAVKSYQHRHGLEETGKLTSQTIRNLNVPLTDRVIQLQDSLERWRWLPDQYLNARLIVNLPEFVLRGYTPEHKLDFTMKVVVGKVVGEHQTPVFAHMMRYLIFRPYWNVPTDIAKAELAPHIEKSPGYLATRNYEAVNGKGDVVPYTAKKVAEGGVIVREKPGPKNSLGLVKFMFPNAYDIYLHSTPSTWLFDHTRRDFSHGCVRVQKPDDLAAWVLNGQNDKDGQPWDLDKVREAMNDGADNHQVNLKTPLPIVIFYVTAEVEPDGHTHFFDDIYGYDADLQRVLSKGPPYPVKPEPAAPIPKPGETA